MEASKRQPGADLMSAYLDDELPPEEVAALEAFLEESPQAREELEALRRVVSLVGTLAEVDAPDDFYEKLSRRIRRRSWLRGDQGWLTWAMLSFQVLGILVILAAAALFMMAELEREHGPLVREPAEWGQLPDAGGRNP